MEEKREEFEGWALVELLGHRRLYGQVTPTTLAGAGILRVDIADHEGGFTGTVYVPPSSLYALTPMTEEALREAVRPYRPILPLALPQVMEDPFDDAPDFDPDAEEDPAAETLEEKRQADPARAWDW